MSTNEKDLASAAPPVAAPEPSADKPAETEEKPRVRRVLRSAVTGQAEGSTSQPADPSADSGAEASPAGGAEGGAEAGAGDDGALFARPKRAPLPPTPLRSASAERKPFDFRSAERRPPQARDISYTREGEGRPEGGLPRRPFSPGGRPPGAPGEGGPRGPRPPREGGPRPPREGGPRLPREGGPRPPREGGPRPPRGGDRDGRSHGRPEAPGGAARPPRPGLPPARPSQPSAQRPGAPPPTPSRPKAPAGSGPLHIPHAKSVLVAQRPALTPKEALKAKLAKRGVVAPPEAPRSEPVAKADPAFAAADLGATWETAVAAASSAGDAAAALVDAWTKGNNAAAVAAVAEAEAAPSLARKAAKRGLAVLKARGVAIPQAPRPAASALAAVDEPISVSMRIPDGTGVGAFVFQQREPSGRYHIAEVIFGDTSGILYAGAGWLSASNLKEAHKRSALRQGVTPIDVPVDWARLKVAEAKKRNSAAGQVLPMDYDRCRELIEPPPEHARHPLADLEEALEGFDVAKAVLSSAELHAEPEFESWAAERAALNDMLAALGQRLGADGARDPDKAGQALREEVLSACDRFFSPERRATLYERLRDATVSLRERKGAEAAKSALAVARAVRDAGLVTAPPREIPFLVGLFDKAVGALAQSGQLRIPVAQPASA